MIFLFQLYKRIFLFPLDFYVVQKYHLLCGSKILSLMKNNFI